MGIPFQRERRGRQESDKRRRSQEKTSLRETTALRRNTSRNRSRQFGGPVPGRAPASEGGPPRILQNTASSLLGGTDEFLFQNRRR